MILDEVFLVLIKNKIFFKQIRMSEQQQNIFIAKLSNQEKNYLSSLLPLGYSFQLGTLTTNGNKNALKKVNNLVKEEIVV